MDNGASLESLNLKTTNILFSSEKNNNINVWMRFSICKLQKHSRVGDADSSSLPLFTKWYFKFTILVDLYGPLKLVLIFSASTGPTPCICIYTLYLKQKLLLMVFPNFRKRQLSFRKTKSNINEKDL